MKNILTKLSTIIIFTFSFIIQSDTYGISKEAQENIKLDYVNAHKLNKKHDQVPNDELLFTKVQSSEPTYFSDGPLRGRGMNEPVINFLIGELRKNNVIVYTDYFTPAKIYFYYENNYSVCLLTIRSFLTYKKMFEENNIKLQKLFNKYFMVSLPFMHARKLTYIAVNKNKLAQVERHRFPHTDVYDLKGLVDDSELKTIQVKDRYTSIKDLIYIHPETNRTLKKEYRYRIYDFVASNNIQIPLMLRGQRMDCAPRSSGKGNVVT